MSDIHDSSRDLNLEPRVAKLEGQLDRLTDDVQSLASIVREQGNTVEKQLSELTVAVTQAAGPKKTDWATIISAVLLIMAIGSAAFWPLNQTVEENKQSLEELNEKFVDHNKLILHPAGQVLVQRLELQLKEYIESNEREMSRHLDGVKEMNSYIEKNLNKHVEYIQKIHDLELSALKEKIQFHDDRLYGRVAKLEDRNSMEIEREKDELQMWRLKSMGINVNPSVNAHVHENTEQKNN